jgi:hypothetical protein
MAKSGWLTWNGKFVEWKHLAVRSKRDLSLHPHFEITLTNGEKGSDTKAVVFEDIQVADKKLKGIDDFMELPAGVQSHILNRAMDAWEAEYSDARR